MSDIKRLPLGSVKLICSNCRHTVGWNLFETVTDIGKPRPRYYAVCRSCGHIQPLRAR